MRTTPSLTAFGRLAAAALVTSGLALGIGSRIARADTIFPRPDLISVEAVAGSTTSAELYFIDRADGDTHYEIKAHKVVTNGQNITASTMVPGVPGRDAGALRRIHGLDSGGRYCFTVTAVRLAGGYDVSPPSYHVCYTMPSVAPTPNVPVPPAPPAPAPAPAASFPVLREGAQGEAVASLQLLLREHGLDVVVDGDFGPQTAQAVREFQKLKGLSIDGAVGPQTWQALIVTVRQGSQGEAVVAVQRLLQAHGVDVVVDGDFGAQTAQAVREFQKIKGLAVDGIVGLRTWQALLSGN